MFVVYFPFSRNITEFLTLCHSTRMERAMQGRMMTGNRSSSSGGLAPSPSSSRRPNRLRSSSPPCTPASLRTRATCAPLYVFRTTPLPCPPTPPRPSCHPCVRAQDSTSPPFCPPLLPATRAFRRRPHPSPQHVASCAQVGLIKAYGTSHVHV